MKRLLFILLLVLGLQLFCEAQEEDFRFRVVTVDGKTYMDGEHREVLITASRPDRRTLRKGQRRLKKYTRLRWNVHKTYPYAVKLRGVLAEVDQDLNSIGDKDLRKAYLSARERELFQEYEDDLKAMSRSQGRVLVKLIYRETGTSSYELIKNAKSPAAAFFWQSVGSIFGIDLKSAYDFEEDQMIEDIVAELQDGGYNICYRQYDYKL